MFLDLLYVLNRITTAANQWLITINRLADNHQPIGRQSSTVWFIIINHTADNYRPLKCNGCLNEENGVTGW